jgi:glycosyltransferase involved in cell wall biosynthesis
MRATLSALVLARDAECHLDACLESIAFVDQVVVVEDGSRDRTCEIAVARGALVLERRLERFDLQRNFGLTHCTGDWVLVVDTDERVTAELRAEIEAVVARPAPVVAYRMPRRNHLGGRWVRGCGWYPDYVVRLFRRTGARYVGAVHEHVEVQGTVGTLASPLLHFTYANVDELATKLDRYATMWAAEQVALGRRSHWWQPAVHATAAFVKAYLLRRGFLDGRAGLLVSAAQARYVFRKYANC